MRIWVDADACPGVLKDLIINAAIKRGVETLFVSNKLVVLPPTELLRFIQVAQGADIADQYIAEHAEGTDLVITQDIPLAGILVPKGVGVISFHGTLFTEHNIGERLSIRNFLTDLRDTGTQTSGPKPFNEKDKRQFANAFDQQLTKRMKS